MIGPSKIWICMIGIIIICTIASGLMWQNFGQSNREQQKQSIRQSMTIYQSEKESVKYLETDMYQMQRYSVSESPDMVKIGYRDGNNHTVVMETYVNGIKSQVQYDIDTNGQFDVVHIFKNPGLIPYMREYDINKDGIYEISEQDENQDGIIDSSEMRLRIDGQFMPFTTINAMIM
jgi:hypothetical protein